jgi:hypothetical protein
MVIDIIQDILGRNLQNIGLIDKDTEYLSARTHEFCPHHVSHYLVRLLLNSVMCFISFDRVWMCMTVVRLLRDNHCSQGW